MNEKGFVVNLAVYPFDILVWFGEDIAKMGKKLKKHISSAEVDELLAQDFDRGKTCLFSTSQTVLWLPKPPQDAGDMAALNHEIFHAVSLILNKVGMKLDDSEEAYAYLIQYVSEQIYRKLPMFSS